MNTGLCLRAAVALVAEVGGGRYWLHIRQGTGEFVLFQKPWFVMVSSHTCVMLRAVNLFRYSMNRFGYTTFSIDDGREILPTEEDVKVQISHVVLVEREESLFTGIHGSDFALRSHGRSVQKGDCHDK